MRVEGSLSKWNDERGFGFITPAQGGQEVFVHVSMFPKNGVRPMIGERLTFEMKVDSSGKKQAINLDFPHRKSILPSNPARASYVRHKKSQGYFGKVISLLFLISLAVYGYDKYLSKNVHIDQADHQVDKESTTPSFRCDGRTHCSHMTSCAEAKFFLNNCPTVKMDGDGDGIPCEQQWCR